MATFLPRNEEEVCELVRWAAAGRETLAVTGSGSRGGFGHAMGTAHGISVSGLAGIRDYDPCELVLTAGPGTPLAEVQSALAAHGQHLAFEPPCPTALYGGETSGTLGGVFLGNQSGPRRFHAGAARDHILGLHAVNGRGEAWKTGGKVIKNVTGYDLSKLLAGSWGTLSIVTEITCKVLPAAAHGRTVAVPVADATSATALLTRAASGALGPTGLAYLPDTLQPMAGPMASARGQCLIRLEGTEAGVNERLAAMLVLLEPGARSQVWADAESILLWDAVRDAAPLSPCPVILKLSLPPAQAPAIAGVLAQHGIDAWYLDAAGAWLWLGTELEGAAELVRSLRAHLQPGGGAVVIMRAPEPLKSAVGVLTPPPAALAALLRRLKESFDPLHLFNPGRLYPN